MLHSLLRRARTVAVLAVLVTAGALVSAASGAAGHRHAPAPDPSGVPMPVGNKPGWTQVFKDNFNGKRLDAKWLKYRGAVAGSAGGWWAASQATVRKGELVLKTSQNAVACTDPVSCPLFNDEVSGGVKSVFGFTYGKVLIRVRTKPVPDTDFLGILWPASNVPPPEMDFAVEGGTTHLATIGAILKYGADESSTLPDSVTANAGKWHTLGVIWGPGEVQYTIDGRIWATETNPNVSSVPMNIVLQAQTDCQAVPLQTCPAPLTAVEPNVDVDWVVAYSPQA